MNFLGTTFSSGRETRYGPYGPGGQSKRFCESRESWRVWIGRRFAKERLPCPLPQEVHARWTQLSCAYHIADKNLVLFEDFSCILLTWGSLRKRRGLVSMNYRNKFLLIIVSTIFVFYAVVGGLLGRATAKEGAYTQLSVFNEVLSKIRSSY